MTLQASHQDRSEGDSGTTPHGLTLQLQCQPAEDTWATHLASFHLSFSMCTMGTLIRLIPLPHGVGEFHSENNTPKRHSPVSASKKWSNKYWLLILLESRAYMLQFPDLECSPGHVSWKWMPLTTCVVVAEHTLDQVLWSQSVQLQMSSEQDRKCNALMMSAQQANLMVYYWALSLRPLHVSQHKARKTHWWLSPWFSPRPTFGVVLLPIVALLKCGDMEGVVFFRGKVSLR